MHQWNFSFRRCRNYRRRRRRRRRRRQRKKSCEPILFLRIEIQLTYVCACVHCARVRACVCVRVCVVYVCNTAYSQNVYEWVNFRSINRIGCRQNVQWNPSRNYNAKKTNHQQWKSWQNANRTENARLSISKNWEIDEVKCALDKGKFRVRTIWYLPYYGVRVCVCARLSL